MQLWCYVMERNCFPHAWHLTDGFSAGFESTCSILNTIQNIHLLAPLFSTQEIRLRINLHASWYSHFHSRCRTREPLLDFQLSQCVLCTYRKKEREIEKGSISLSDQRRSTGQLDVELLNRKCLPPNGTLVPMFPLTCWIQTAFSSKKQLKGATLHGTNLPALCWCKRELKTPHFRKSKILVLCP